MDFLFIAFMSHPINPGTIFVIIPAYNENTIIQLVVQELLKHKYQLVIVDDGSSNSLFPLLKNKPLYILRHKVNLGQGAALQTGIEFALTKKADYIVTFDADGQHKSDDIEVLLQTLVSFNVDIVLGSRFMEHSVHNMPVTRRIILHWARYLNYLFTGLLLSDAHNGLRAMTRKAANTLQIEENGMAHATEILSQIKKRKLLYAEVPVNIYYSPYSRKKGQTIWNSFRIFFDILLNKIFR